MKRKKLSCTDSLSSFSDDDKSTTIPNPRRNWVRKKGSTSKRTKIDESKYFIEEHWKPYDPDKNVLRNEPMGNAFKFLSKLKIPSLSNMPDVNAKGVQGYSRDKIRKAYSKDKQYLTLPKVKRLSRGHNTAPAEREPTHRSTDPETIDTDKSRDISYIMNTDRPCVDDNENTSMKRNIGDKIRFTNDFDQIKDEKLFVREGVNYDLDKFRVYSLNLMEHQFMKTMMWMY